jgi:hypothetical protein
MLECLPAGQERLKAAVKTGQEQIRARQENLIATIGASWEKVRTTVSAQDYPEGFGTEMEGTKWELQTQLAENKAWAGCKGSVRALNKALSQFSSLRLQRQQLSWQ